MGSYTILTVFENENSINEPVIRLPLAGRVSFRQIGIIAGLVMILPLALYSLASEHILNVLPEPLGIFPVAGNSIVITWDVVISMLPVIPGLVIGVPRPKLLTMDQLIITTLCFLIHRTSIKSAPSGERAKKPKPQKSRFMGFAAEAQIGGAKRRREERYEVAITELGIPKNITITLYGLDGAPLRNRLARAYIDDELLCSITTDEDGTIGMTFVPRSEGPKRLRITADGISSPIVDAILDVRRQH